MGDLLAELELFHDGAHVPRETVDVTVQIGREIVEVVEQRVDLFIGQCELHSGKIVKTMTGDLLQACLLHTLGLGLQRLEFFQRGLPGRFQQALKAAQHRKRQDDLAVFVAFIGAT